MSDPVKRWRPLLARVPLFVSLLAGVIYAVGVYTEFRFKDKTSLVNSAEGALLAALVYGGGTRVVIALAPKVVLGALLGAVLAFPLFLVLGVRFGDAGFDVGFGLMLIGALAGVVVAFKYKLW